MMTPELTAAAERLVSLPGFRWMSGMVDTNGNRFVDVSEGIIEIDGSLFQYSRGHYSAGAAALPDLTDPATRGCVLAMVREAWGDPSITLRYSAMAESYNCVPWFASGDYDFRGNSEAECLVNALAAAAGAR